MSQIVSPPAHAVAARFASRPTLADVARQQLTATFAQAYPNLSIDLTRTQLAVPASAGGWALQPLMPRVLAFLAGDAALGMQDNDGRPCFLTDHPPTRLKQADGQPLDMAGVEDLIRTLPWTLPIALQNALAEYWRQAPDGDSSRWRWLSELLADTLTFCAAHQADLTSTEREMLYQLVNEPVSEDRIERFGSDAAHLYFPYVALTDGHRTQRVLGPDLLILCPVNGRPQALLCQPAGTCQRFASADAALQAWAGRVTQDRTVAQITLHRFEPDGDVFETQAAIMLEQHLQQLQALKLPANQGLDTLQAVYRQITEPASAFSAHPVSNPRLLETLRPLAPRWLQQAPPTDQARYRHYSLALACAKKRSQGLTFLSDIPDIRTFTHAALLTWLQAQDTSAAPPDPDDLLLIFNVAAGYPGGAGFVEPVHMSLTDLAIRNLQGRPRGQLTLKHRHDTPLPPWLTPDAITDSGGLIQSVDIGKTYPELLRSKLLGDNEAVRQRERRFAAHTVVQLPLQALELRLKGEQGFTARGAACVAALVASHASQRHVDGNPIVIRHLTLVRKPQATPDIVANMYVIEAENGQVGPHILYRPLYTDSLREFADRAHLLAAIASAGDLQDSVLTWLSDGARPIYANGGFQQPHYVRFGIGDEFERPEVPQPATLGSDGANDELLQCLANGQLMAYLYGANARALVDQADRESVSNAESRWAVFLEGASLLFNTLLLPLARGPLMAAGWLLSLMTAASRDIPGLASDDPTARELAWADLLLNVGMLMFELAPSTQSLSDPVPTDTQWRALRSPLSRRLADQWPEPPAPGVQQGAVLLGGGGAGLADTVFDFSFASARNRLTPGQQARLVQFQVPRPKDLSGAVPNGPRRGLFQHYRDWYAQVDAHWYNVRAQADGAALIVHPFDSTLSGPYLQADATGNWSLDLRLRLRGGMPPKRIAAERERKALRKRQLEEQQANFLSPRQEMRQGRLVTFKSLQEALQEKADNAQQLMTRAADDPKYSAAARANTRRNFDAALQEQVAAYEGLLNSRQERRELGITMPDSAVAVFLENTVNNARKSVVVADMDRQALYAEYPDLSASPEQALPALIANPVRYNQFLQALSDVNERQVRALELKDRYLLELFNLGPSGRQAYERLTHGRPDELGALSLKYLQLQSLKYLSRKTWHPGVFISDLDLTLDPLATHLRTHSELNHLNLAPTDRLAVLDSLFEHYGQALDALQGMAMIHAEHLEMHYFQRIQALVESLYQDVLQQLAAEVKPRADAIKRPPKRALISSGKPTKKVIRTRKQGILIGDLKPAGSTLPIDVVEVRSEQDNHLLATYSQHESGWDEVRETRRPSQPSLPPQIRPLSAVKGEARKQIMALEGIIKREEGYAKVSRFPIEIQESLDHEARRFDALAGEFERAVTVQTEGQPTTGDDQTLINQLRAAFTRLTAMGKALRLQRALELPPTDTNLAFLLEQDKVQLARLGERIALRGERRDFIQEYAVNDKRGFPLWYAHFHYPKADTPKLEYAIAHLKTKEQRRESYYSLLAKAESAQSVVDVHRGEISRALAERRFLPLAP